MVNKMKSVGCVPQARVAGLRGHTHPWLDGDWSHIYLATAAAPRAARAADACVVEVGSGSYSR